MGRWAIVLSALLATACVRPQLVTCDDGTACPSGTACETVHGGCVEPEQLTSCAPLSEGDDCTAGTVIGGCFDGVCLPRGCGNRIAEVGEQCDDGNQLSGDGCSGNCLSSESCGNGVLDAGEECDDGNLLSHDDCSSGCLRETPQWSFIPFGPSSFFVGAYDEARQRFVASTFDAVWELANERWSVIPTERQLGNVAYYDTDRDAVVVLDGSTPYTWDGATWNRVTTTGTAPLQAVAAAYDRGRGYAVVVGLGNPLQLWKLDGAGAWASLGALDESGGRVQAAYDAPNQRVVIVEQVNGPWKTYSVGATNTSTTVTPFSNDEDAQVVLGSSVDGVYAYDTFTGSLFHISAPLTHEAVALPPEGVVPPRAIYYDTARAALSLLTSSGWSWRDGTGWHSGNSLSFAFAIAATADQRLVIPTGTESDGNVQLWTVDSTLVHDPLDPNTPPAGSRLSSIYAPGRRAMIAHGVFVPTLPSNKQYAGTSALDRDGWRSLPSAISGPTAGLPGEALAYDAVHRRVLLADGARLWSLADDAADWSDEGMAYQSSLQSIAYDVRSDTLVGHIPNGPLLQLDPATGFFVSTLLAPTKITRLLVEERTAGILMYDAQDAILWDRRGDVYARLPLPAAPLEVRGAAYRARDGSAVFTGYVYGGAGATVFRRTSPTPDESCVVGEDADGDGLAYCDDPDCYWACSTCPPYTTCRFDLAPE